MCRCGSAELGQVSIYRDSEKWMLIFVAGEKSLSEVGDQEVFRKDLKEEKRSQWLEKPPHSRSLNDT